MGKNLYGEHKRTAHRRIFAVNMALLAGFFILTIMNEVVDVPHYFFGDVPTSWEQRKGEMIFEAIIYAMIVFLAAFYYKRLKDRTSILEGLLSICSSCKKIRQDKDWVVLEEYISSHSLADFSHGLCPECIRKLYPEHASEIIAEMKAKGFG